MSTKLIGESLIRIGGGKEKKGEKCLKCRAEMYFEKREGKEKELEAADFCQVRLCPACTWRNSLKTYAQVSQIMNYMEEKYDYKFVFLTLSAEGVKGEKLTEFLDEFFQAFSDLTKLRRFRNVIKGWFRAFDITHDWETGNYHPRFHVILVVDKSYVEKSDGFISQGEWVTMWKFVLRVGYKLYVDVHSTEKDKSANADYKETIAETARYAAGMSDLIYEPTKELINELGEAQAQAYANKRTDEVVEIMDDAFYRRVLAAYGWVFKEARRTLKKQGEIFY